MVKEGSRPAPLPMGAPTGRVRRALQVRRGEISFAR